MEKPGKPGVSSFNHSVVRSGKHSTEWDFGGLGFNSAGLRVTEEQVAQGITQS